MKEKIDSIYEIIKEDAKDKEIKTSSIIAKLLSIKELDLNSKEDVKLYLDMILTDNEELTEEEQKLIEEYNLSYYDNDETEENKEIKVNDKKICLVDETEIKEYRTAMKPFVAATGPDPMIVRNIEPDDKDIKIDIEEDKIAKKSNKVKLIKRFKVNDKIKLNKCDVYLNSESTEAIFNLSGTFYIFNDLIINNRIKISKSKNNGIVGWVDLEKIKVNM